MWRSLVARYTGGVEVAGSNPVIPTTESSAKLFSRSFSRYVSYLFDIKRLVHATILASINFHTDHFTLKRVLVYLNIRFGK